MQKTVFFVDDEKMILNLLEYTIKNHKDFEIKTFRSGEECLENLSLNPDLIILDHVFQSENDVVMNGLETLKKIREMNREIPVVILSGQEDKDLHKKYLDSGANDFIQKDDYFIDSLMEVIDRNL